MEDTEILAKWEIFKNLLLSTNREGIESLIDWLDKSDFKFAPASTQYHNDFKGGLLDHSLNVYYLMYDFISFINFFNIPKETVILTALLHDICKSYFYSCSTRNVKNEQTGKWDTVPYYVVRDECPYGHGEKSVMWIMNHIKLTIQERMMIRWHMGFTKDNSMDVSNAFSKYPEVMLLHFADQIATYVPESKDLPSSLKSMFIGRNLSESLELLDKREPILVNGTEYKLALPNAIVDGKIIIEVEVEGKKIKVYSPHGDGLPF